jgi:hypothetical protein
MAFPVIASVSKHENDTNVRTKAIVAKPSGTVSGELLIAVIKQPWSVNWTLPTGWTAITSITSARFFAAAKITTVGEPSTYDFLHDGVSVRDVSYCYRITGFYVGADVTDSVTAIFTNAADANSLALELPPGWSAADVLWINVLSSNRTDWDATGLADYSTPPDQIESAADNVNTNYVKAAYVTRELNAVSEDPGAWSYTGNVSGPATILIAVLPTVASASGPEISGASKIQSGKPFSVSGARFGVALGTGDGLILSPTDDAADVNAVVQVVDSWSDTELSVTSASLPVGLVGGDAAYLFVETETGIISDGLLIAIADPVLRVDQLLRDTDAGTLVTASPGVVVFSGGAVTPVVEHNAESVSVTAGVLEIVDAAFSISEISETRHVVLFGSGDNAGVYPGTVVDRNDDV